MRRAATISLLITVATAALFYFFAEWSGAPAEGSYRLAKSDRGEIVATVNATGTINPTTTVIVGSQLSGQVVEVLADYNSEVKADQVVARLNSDQIRAKLDAARADLAQMRATQLVQQGQIEKVRAETDKARAAQADMEAQVARNEALSEDTERIFQRQSDLRARGFAAEAAFTTARATRDAQTAALNSARAQVNSAKAVIAGLAADLTVAQANLEAVKAQIEQREAAVRQIEVDLRNTEIRSPVSGVDRPAQCRARPDRRRLAAGARTVPDRRRSAPHGDRRQYRRDRCRPHRARPARDLHASRHFPAAPSRAASNKCGSARRPCRTS